MMQKYTKPILVQIIISYNHNTKNQLIIDTKHSTFTKLYLKAKLF
jgi:hypothetical protein